VREDRVEAGRRGELADAARGKRRVVGEVASLDVPAYRADGVRNSAYEDATGCQRCGHVVERPENLGLGKVLEQVGGRDRRVVSRLRGEDGSEISLTDPGHACRMGQCHLFRTDVYALRVKAVRLQQPDELTPSTAKVDHGSGRGCRQQRADVAPVDESSRSPSAAADMLCGVCLIKTAPQVVQSSCSHD